MDGKTHRNFILTASIVPPIAFAAAIVLLWHKAVDEVDLAIFAGMYLLCSIGLGVGFHRLFTHRAFKTKKPTRLALAVLGTMGAEGPPIVWVSHHRKHHALADVEGDPHSPHLHGEQGLKGAFKGLWHSHWGWLFRTELTSDPMRYAPDLVREKEMRWISQHFLAIVAAGLILPGIAGFAIKGTVGGLLTGFLWGGLVRMFVLHHITYSVNSVGHYFGRRRFVTDDKSKNVALLAIPTLGEAWHHNHHAFPTSYTHGLKWYEVDLAALVIRGLERLGLAWDLVRISPARQESKLATAPAGAVAGPRPAGVAGGRSPAATDRVTDEDARTPVGAGREVE
jgi:stearoyl-CoA desaturase (delta-9 desaturase)